MTTLISVTRKWQLEALLEIENLEFQHWYELGVWWAIYGEEQGIGQYNDQYLIVNLTSHITSGWYDDPQKGWLPMLGFELGMAHGGYLTHLSDTLVVLSDPDFAKGYEVGRDYCFNEAPLEGRIFSDILFCQSVQEWAKGYAEWRDPDAVLRYVLGCRIGELSGALIPALLPDPAPEAVTRH